MGRFPSVLAAVLLLAGCQSMRFTYEEPPAVAALERSESAAAPTGATVMIHPFKNPAKASVPWPDIGPDMSDALARTLLNEGRLNVRVSAEVNDEVDSILKGDPETYREGFRKLGREHADVDFIVTGHVTDFLHTGDDGTGPSRRTWYLTKRNEAVVAFQLHVVDVRAGLLEVSDHVFGASNVGDASAAEIYGNTAFGTYLFWSTPLGKASREAIDKATERLDKLVPSHASDVRVLTVKSPREIVISGGRNARMKSGERFYVCRDAPRGTPQPIRDATLGQPVMAHVLKVEDATSSAWLVGRLPADVAAHELVLRRKLPGPAGGGETPLAAANGTADG